MWRNIMCQSFYQIIILLLLLFKGAEWFGIRGGVTCERYASEKNSVGKQWSLQTLEKVEGLTTIDATTYLQCSDYIPYCGGEGIDCLEKDFNITKVGSWHVTSLSDFKEYEDSCLECNKNGYTHGSLIFNTFIFCQFFNEYTARKIFDEVNMFEGVFKNFVFLGVSLFTLGCQVFLIEVGGEFLKTSHLNIYQWLITIGLGAASMIVGVLMRFIPVKEDPNCFFDSIKHDQMAASHNGVTSKSNIEMTLLKDKDADKAVPL